MTLKRRSFLAMLGAAAATPALPGGAPVLSARVKALAAAHARKYPFVSVIGLSKRVGVTTAEAEGLLAHLSQRGMVGPVRAAATGPVSAASNLFRPAPSLAYAAQARAAARQATIAQAARQRAKAMLTSGPARDWLHHLRRLCVQNGIELHPRAYEVSA